MVAARRVPAHLAERLLLRLDQLTGLRAEGALTFDEAAAGDPRPRDGPGVNALDKTVEHVILVTHVAHRGDPGGDVEKRAALRAVALHLIRAGADGASGAAAHRPPLEGRCGGPAGLASPP